MNKKILIIAGTLSLCVVFAAVQYAAPVYGDDSLPAEVTIVSPSAESYGARVIVSSQVFLRWFALGEPDGEGARMLRKGWVDIELEDRVTDCSEVSIWARKAGWGVASFTVYISADGNTWTHIGGGKCTSTSYSQYDFSGDFGDVKYIKVKRNGWGRWSVMMLDAVMAERW